MCDGRFPFSSTRSTSPPSGPQSPGVSAASSDLAAVAASAEPGAALASGPVSGTFGASDPDRFLSGVAPFESPSGPPAAPGLRSFRPGSRLPRDDRLTLRKGRRKASCAGCGEKRPNQLSWARFGSKNTPFGTSAGTTAPPLHLRSTPVGGFRAFARFRRLVHDIRERTGNRRLDAVAVRPGSQAPDRPGRVGASVASRTLVGGGID